MWNTVDGLDATTANRENTSDITFFTNKEQFHLYAQ